MLQFKIAEFIGAIRGAMERGVNEGGVVTEEMVSCVFFSGICAGGSGVDVDVMAESRFGFQVKTAIASLRR